MAAEKIIPFEIFKERKRQMAPAQAQVQRDRVVICLETARNAQTLDVVRANRLEEQKTPFARTGLDLTDFKRQVYDGHYAIDPEDLAETILDTLLMSK